MFDLDKETIEEECPHCRFYNSFTLKQVRLRDAVICRGCKAKVQLDDHLNTCRKAVRQVQREMDKLEAALGKLGTIRIEL